MRRHAERAPDGLGAGPDGPHFAVDLVSAGPNEAVGAGRGSRARAGLAVAAWVLGFAGVVGVALFGRLLGPGDPAAGVASAPLATPGAESMASPRSGAAASAQPGTDAARADAPTPDALIVVVSPATGEPTITSGELIVQGSVQADAHSLRVVVEALGRPLDAQTVQPARPVEEGTTTRQRARFLVRIQLPDPRPIGPMVVEVVAFDRSGERLAVVRRPFRLGRVDRPTLGDDGLLGGIVFSEAEAGPRP